jgi:xanthine/uracil permease
MRFTYNLNERPPLLELILFGLQWVAIVVPTVIIIGRIVGSIQGADSANQVLFMQKTCMIIAVVVFCQVLWGHQLPLIAGPATVLVVGIIASKGFSPTSVYTAIMLGGCVLSIISMAGLFSHVRKLFTQRVVAVILLLIAFTLAPTIMQLVVGPDPEVAPLPRLAFATGLTLLMFLAVKYVKGVWKSTIVLWSMLVGSLAYVGLTRSIHPGMSSSLPLLSLPFHALIWQISVEPGVLLSFLICFLGLAINDVGSIESIGELIRPSAMTGRMKRGIILTGLANILAGFLGVIGMVNYSLSPGVIMATGCASRFTLIPTAVVMALLAFSPLVIGFLGSVPSVVVGSVFLYLLSYQVAAGLTVASEGVRALDLETGLVIGLPALLGTVVAFLPATVVVTFPAVLKPVAGNGFLVGVVTVLILEHIVFRR